MFEALSTQLRVSGMGQIIGVDLSTFSVICDAKNIPHCERGVLLDKILLVNSVAVKHWSSKDDE